MKKFPYCNQLSLLYGRLMLNVSMNYCCGSTSWCSVTTIFQLWCGILAYLHTSDVLPVTVLPEHIGKLLVVHGSLHLELWMCSVHAHKSRLGQQHAGCTWLVLRSFLFSQQCNIRKHWGITNFLPNPQIQVYEDHYILSFFLARQQLYRYLWTDIVKCWRTSNKSVFLSSLKDANLTWQKWLWEFHVQKILCFFFWSQFSVCIQIW